MKKIMTVLLSIIISLTVIYSSLFVHADSYSVNVQLPNYDSLVQAYGQVSLTAYLVQDNIDVKAEEQTTLLQRLNTLPNESLIKEYPIRVHSNEVNQNDSLQFKNLTYGLYYIRQDELTKSIGIHVASFLVSVFDNNLTVVAKTEIDAEQGSKSFVKVSTSKRVLQGAEFKVYKQLTNGSYQLVDDKTYVSGENGRFEVSGLLYGNYYLQEIKAPVGYIKSTEYIPFTIDSSSSTSEVTEIKNKPDNPPGIDIPQTGNAVLFFTVISGLLLVLLGLRLIRLSNK